MAIVLAEAINVLSRVHHRGAWVWGWDPARLRVTPLDWSGEADDPAPEFTAFEALVIARGLAQIGAGDQGMSTDMPGR
jgi:hypothetical protein